ncbi:hypothetical protein D3C78_1717120 [compost metagenome]
MNRPSGCRADVAVLRLEGFRVIADVLRNGAQVLKVEQQQPLLVGNAEDNIQYTRLHVVQIEQTRQQQWPQIGDGGAHRVAFLAENIPHHHRIALRLPVGDADVF